MTLNYIKGLLYEKYILKELLKDHKNSGEV